MAREANCATTRRGAGLPGRRRRKSAEARPEAAMFRRRMPIAHGIWLVALAIGSIIGGHRVLAEEAQHPPVIHLTGVGQSLDADLVLVCPQSGATEPQFQNEKTGKVSPISDPRLRAVAQKACQPGLAAAESSDVDIVNKTGSALYVGFSPQAGSSITWGSGCGTPIKALTVEIKAGATCQAAVTDSVASPGSRFCAAKTVGSSGLDCSRAQQNNQTLVETNFQPAPCVGINANCIWYDISVIPSNCTDATWSKNYCANTGDAAYNLPVSLTCTGQPTYTCKGPPFTSGNYAAADYPANCGNPLATCFGNGASCVNAYFWPMFGIQQPNAVCPSGQTLAINFLSGP